MGGFKTVGWVLLLCFVGWLGFSLSTYSILRPAPATLQPSSGFEGNSLLPATETQPHFDHARSRMLAINAHGEVFSVIDNVAAWASFLSTAAVTLILGYLGRRASSADAAANFSGVPPKTARLIGVLAALAAVLTAAGAMAKNESRDDYQKADSARDYINATVSDLAGSKSQQEARDALDQLDLQIGRL